MANNDETCTNEIDDKIFNIVVLGNTGVGKSALLNMLSGSPDSFKVGENAYSETQLAEAKVFTWNNEIKLRLVDTQGLTDTGGDTKDMEHIKQMVERLKKLETVDLFLICLDGTNPRFTPYTRSTIELFENIFSKDFLNHCVLVFNKWTSPDEQKKANLKEQYQAIIKNNYNKNNIPCYFLDSFCNLPMLRDNDDGTRTVRTLHPNVQQRTISQLVGLLNFVNLKGPPLDVTGIKPVEIDSVKLKNLAQAAEERAKNAEDMQKKYLEMIEESKQKEQKFQQDINEITKTNQSLNDELKNLKQNIYRSRDRSRGGFCTIS